MDVGKKKAGIRRQEVYLFTMGGIIVMCSIALVFQQYYRPVLTVELVEQTLTNDEIRCSTAERVRNGTKELNEFDRIVQGLPSKRMFPCPDSIGRRYYCQNYTADWVGETDIKQLLEGRMEKVRKRCSKYQRHIYNASLSKYGKSGSSKEFSMKRVLTNSRLNLAFCWVPKTGSTFMQHAWTPLSKAAITPLQSFIRQPSKLSAIFLHTFWQSQASEKKPNDSYTAFTVSRNPWQRLVSVYREKCQQTGPSHQCKLYFGERCSQRNRLVTFKTFIQCVMDMMVKEQTEFYGHVEPSYKRCGICDYSYRYVVLMENLVNETGYIFKEAGVLDPLPIMQDVRKQTIRPIEIANTKVVYSDYWKQIPPEMIDKIRFLYRYEILLFDFPETPFINPSS